MSADKVQFGSGSGSGSGYGYGYGDGYGDGYGYGSEYFKMLLFSYTPQAGEVLCFWRSIRDGVACNGGTTDRKRVPGDIESVEGPLAICTPRALHGTMNPEKWKGDYWWIVALREPVQQQDDKLASLSRRMVACLGKYPF